MSSNPQEIWDQILSAISHRLPHESFLTWFGPLKFLGLRENHLTVGVPNQFFYEFLDSHYRDQILEAVRQASGGQLQIQYKILETGDGESAAAEPAAQPDFPDTEAAFDKRTQLNPRYTFENFVEGDSNAFAKAAALAVAESPGKTPFNPLFVYAPSGLGKTHLIQAIGNFSLARNRALRAIYVTSEKFMNDFIFAIKTYKTTDFSRFYRSVDLLLLDDIQFFQGKERTQLEFFHTFNSLYQSGKQIVLTSDRPLKELVDFEKRLTSRIGWGLVTDIHPPDYETRLAILQKRAESEGFSLPEEVSQFLAGAITDNVRALESALIRLMAHCSIIGSDITLALTRELLREFLPAVRETVSLDHIQQTVAQFFNLPSALLIARNRKREVAWARQVAMYLCVELTGSSLQSIGAHFGNRDHSTVIHARDLVAQQVAQDPQVALQISKLKADFS
ncbi:MAG: chromosomal replication initiator protein DnaA [Candidatus Zixiibacteriota bacterium]|nr:MAG: chromosomal replication initiator protein DnaA [candidate division Zixibacteria bacterium]